MPDELVDFTALKKEGIAFFFISITLEITDTRVDVRIYLEREINKSCFYVFLQNCSMIKSSILGTPTFRCLGNGMLTPDF